jgi:phosphate transport system substrate-binding protein
MLGRAFARLVCVVAVILAIGCKSGTKEDIETIRLQGAGATFPAPFYKRLVVTYQELHPSVLIDYQPNGSGGGIRGITDKTVHFAASDAPMSGKELEEVGGEEAIVEFPTCSGSVVPSYNLPGLTAELRFTGNLLADIYLGKVSRWNDAAIAKLNADLQLPDLAITPVWRSDGSGTTFVFTNYLASQSDEFKTRIGTGKQVQWPYGQGGKGNEGVTAVVQQTMGGIGYVEQGYADSNHLLYGLVKNNAGKFVRASPESVSAAGVGPSATMKGNVLAAEIWNQPGDKAYPIASFTYLIVYRDLQNLPDKASAEALADFLWWMTHDGQRSAAELGYAPLAPEVQRKVEAALRSLNFKGQAIRVGAGGEGRLSNTKEG